MASKAEIIGALPDHSAAEAVKTSLHQLPIYNLMCAIEEVMLFVSLAYVHSSR
jgi:hypothetical protein